MKKFLIWSAIIIALFLYNLANTQVLCSRAPFFIQEDIVEACRLCLRSKKDPCLKNKTNIHRLEMRNIHNFDIINKYSKLGYIVLYPWSVLEKCPCCGKYCYTLDREKVKYFLMIEDVFGREEYFIRDNLPSKLYSKKLMRFPAGWVYRGSPGYFSMYMQGDGVEGEASCKNNFL